MKIKRIHVENYGCISCFDYTFFKSQEEINRPLVLIGKNGSGKTLLLSTIIDSLVELKRFFYPDTLQEVNGEKYFSIERNTLIQSGKEVCYCYVEYDNQNKYLDLKSKKLESIKIPKEIDQELINTETYYSTGFSKKTKIVDKTNIFEKDVFLYFPFDRYYIPSWENKLISDESKDNFDASRTNYHKSSLIKRNVSNNLKEWLYRLFGVSYSPYSNPPSSADIDFSIKESINNILQIIWGSNSHIEKPDRKSNSVPLLLNGKHVSDINDLSSGEIMLFSIFASIVKEYDLYHHDGYTTRDISGICIIDEIDMNLHICQQVEALPKLIALFPKIQFIITTHSPFFLKTLFSEMKDANLISMPSGKQINDLIDFNEIKDAMTVFSQIGEETADKLKFAENEIIKLNNEKKTLILTEGKTDTKYIKKAYEKLGIDCSSLQFLPESDSITGDRLLLRILKDEALIKNNSRKIIGIFDHDNTDVIKEIGDSVKEFLPTQIFAFCIPIPLSRNKQTSISIEHYFSDAELKTMDKKGHRLYEFNEFNSITGINNNKDKMCSYVIGKNHNPNYILNGSKNQKVLGLDGIENYSLSKDDFCEDVITDKDGFNSFDFSNFLLITNLISQCIKKQIPFDL